MISALIISDMGKYAQPTSEYDAARDSPGYLLWLMTNKWQAQQRAALQKLDLTHVQFVLLACLTYAPNNENLTQVELAQRAQTDLMMTSQVVRRLAAKGLVQRKFSQKDKRAFNLRPTQKGIKLTDRALQIVEAVDEEFFGVLAADKPIFVDMMRTLVWTPRDK